MCLYANSGAVVYSNDRFPNRTTMTADDATAYPQNPEPSGRNHR